MTDKAMDMAVDVLTMLSAASIRSLAVSCCIGAETIPEAVDLFREMVPIIEAEIRAQFPLVADRKEELSKSLEAAS